MTLRGTFCFRVVTRPRAKPGLHITYIVSFMFDQSPRGGHYSYFLGMETASERWCPHREIEADNRTVSPRCQLLTV